MATERCAAAQAALAESMLAREATLAPEVASHVAECGECARIRDELASLSRALDSVPAPAPPSVLSARARRLARLELAAAVDAASEDALVPASASGLPPGFGRECARLLAGSLAALPLVVGWNALVIWVGGGVLASLLPEPVVGVLAGAYVASVAGGLAFLYGSIPFVAHRRARRSLEEVKT
jgi:hypothetical protein